MTFALRQDQNNQSKDKDTQTGATYTFTESDNGVEIIADYATAQTYTLPEDATEDLPVGFNCGVTQKGAGQITFVVEGSDVIVAADDVVTTRVPGSPVYIEKWASGVWFLAGDLTS